MLRAESATTAWLKVVNLLVKAACNGGEVEDVVFTAPRGIKTTELLNHSMCYDMNRPALQLPERGLSNRFMAAEGYWMLTGRDDASFLERHIPGFTSRFSDDGVSLYGAYGPRFWSQCGSVCDKLERDQDSRQATMVIFKENPPETKDLHCTVAFSFMVREGALHMQVYMRSSDAWLGLPYDMFSFACFGLAITRELNRRNVHVVPGRIYITAASRHLYETDLAAATTLTQRLQTPQESLRYKHGGRLALTVPDGWWYGPGSNMELDLFNIQATPANETLSEKAWWMRYE